MRWVIIHLILSVFLAGSLSAAHAQIVSATPVQSVSEEEQAIRKAVADYVDAYNRHDAEAASALITDDNDVRLASGEVRKGRTAFHEAFVQRHATVFSAAHLVLTVERIHFLKPDIAIVDGLYEATGMKDTAGNPAPPLRQWVTNVMVKQNGKWLITAWRFTPLPAAKDADVKKNNQERGVTPSDVAATEQWISKRPDWVQPVEPFRIADNFYFVGTRGLGEFLFVTPAGDILLDSGLKETVPLVRANIEKLGFKLTDIKILLSSHAHFDHVAGLADMQRATGAQVFALGEDATAISLGTDLSGARDLPGWEPVKVARLLKDGDAVTLGGLTLTAHLTPGHTKGCTTWTTTLLDKGVPHSAVFVCSLSLGYKLLGNTRYPTIADDYPRSFKTLRSLDAEYFFAPHNFMYGMKQKLAKAKTAGTPNPFLDPAGYRAYIDQAEQSYLKQLEQERAAATSAGAAQSQSSAAVEAEVAATIRKLEATRRQALLDGNAADEAAIRKIRAAHDVAYNNHDAKALANLYVPDGDAVQNSGAYQSGRAEIEKRYANAFAGPSKNARVETLSSKIRFLTADVALLDVESVITGRVGGEVRNHVASMYVKRNGEWRLVAERATRKVPATSAAPAESSLNTGEIERLIIDNERAIATAFLKHDPSAAEQFFADDFREIGPTSGRSFTKADMVREAANSNFTQMDIFEPAVQVVKPDVAIYTARYVEARKPSPDATPATRQVRLLVVWVLRNGKWQIVAGQNRPITPASPAGAQEQEITRMERERVDAIKRSDMKALDRIYAPEYTAIVSLSPGKVVSKAQELAVQGPESRRLQSWEPSDVAIRIYGNVGLVTGLADVKDVLRGERRHVRVQYTHVWVKRDDGSWQLVHRHVNRVATLEEPAPPR